MLVCFTPLLFTKPPQNIGLYVVVNTVLPALVIVPLAAIPPVFEKAHTATAEEFLSTRGFDVAVATASKVLVLTKVGRTDIDPVLPPEETDILTYSGPAEKSASILLVLAKPLS